MAVLIGMPVLSAYQTEDLKSKQDNPLGCVINDYSNCDTQTVFRTTQKVRSNDGYEIYFYKDGRCEMYDNNGRLVVSCTYTFSGNDMFLLDERGNTVYKGTCTIKNGNELTRLNIAGQTYWKKK